MSDECWNGLLESVDFIKDFWEVNESANTLELAKPLSCTLFSMTTG